MCTRARGARIAPRRYSGIGVVRSFDLDQFHVLQVLKWSLCLLRFARCRVLSSVRRSVEVTVVSFASGGESGGLCSVPESKNIHRLCRQLGN